MNDLEASLEEFIRRCSEPNAKAQAIYEKLKYKQQPFINRKFVVHKSELQKMEYLIYQGGYDLMKCNVG